MKRNLFIYHSDQSYSSSKRRPHLSSSSLSILAFHLTSHGLRVAFVASLASLSPFVSRRWVAALAGGTVDSFILSFLALSLAFFISTCASVLFCPFPLFLRLVFSTVILFVFHAIVAGLVRFAFRSSCFFFFPLSPSFLFRKLLPLPPPISLPPAEVGS